MGINVYRNTEGDITEISIGIKKPVIPTRYHNPFEEEYLKDIKFLGQIKDKRIIIDGKNLEAFYNELKQIVISNNENRPIWFSRFFRAFFISFINKGKELKR